MSRGNYQEKFSICEHNWELHVDVESCGWPAQGNGIFRCKKCDSYITFLEKCALDQVKAQEKYLCIGMWANIISALVLIIAFLSLIFGDKLIKIIQ